MTGLVAGAGVKAALGSVPWKLVGFIGAGVGVLIFVLLALHWKHQATDRGEKLATICSVTRSAAVNPKMKCSDVPVQIKELGDSVTNLKAGIVMQNAAVNALGAKSKADQAAAAEASKHAQARARGAEATSERLKASARSMVAPSASCEPSKAAKDAWR
jgi:hypothetical protein